MVNRNFSGILTTENGKGIKIQFPISNEDFKKLLNSITCGNLTKSFGIKKMKVNHHYEAKFLTESTSISSINFYCGLVKNLSDAEYNMLRFLLDAGFATEGINDLINLTLNLGNFAFAEGIPDAYTLGKKILEVNADKNDLPSEFDDRDKITWLGEYIRMNADGRFFDGIYIEKTENYKLLFNGPDDVPAEYHISVSLQNKETE